MAKHEFGYSSLEIAQEDAPEGVTPWQDESGEWGWTAVQPEVVTSSDKPDKKPPFALTIGTLSLVIGPTDDVDAARAQGQIVANRIRATLRIVSMTDGVLSFVTELSPNQAAMSAAGGGIERDELGLTPTQRLMFDMATRPEGTTWYELRQLGFGGDSENAKSGNIPYKSVFEQVAAKFPAYSMRRRSLRVEFHTNSKGKVREVDSIVYHLDAPASNVVQLSEAAD